MPRQRAHVEYWLSAANDRWYGHKVNTAGNVVAAVTGGSHADETENERRGYAFRQGVRRAAQRQFPGLPLVLIVDPNAF